MLKMQREDFQHHFSISLSPKESRKSHPDAVDIDLRKVKLVIDPLEQLMAGHVRRTPDMVGVGQVLDLSMVEIGVHLWIEVGPFLSL